MERLPSVVPESAFSPLQLGPIRLKNRIIKTATNEGMAKRGVVTKGLARFHERVAEGGAGMTTVAYCATSPAGRTFIDQVTMNRDSLTDLRALTDGVHRHGAAAAAQLTHAGSFTFLPRSALPQARPISASGGFNKVGVVTGRFGKRAMRRDEMAAMAKEFTAAALTAREAGFDAVELHMGHGYLLSQFVSKLYNKRWDKYGGSIENRMRFPSEVLARVLDAVGKDMAVLVKYSMTDGRRGGNTIEDGIAVARRLEQGGAHMAVLSNGMNVDSITAMFGSSLPKSAVSRPSNPLIAFAMWMQKLGAPGDVTFHENYLRDLALQIRGATTLPLAYLGGVQSLAGVEQAMADGFDAVAAGRALLYDPHAVEQWRAGDQTHSGCTVCNQCVTMMYSPGGTRCILNGPNEPELNLIAAGAHS